MSNTYCPRCGKENAEGATFCTSCGAPLTAPPAGAQYAGPRARRSNDCFGGGEEGECFGLPNGGLIAALVFGGLIILLGIGIWAQWDIGNLAGPIFLVVLGVLLVAGALYTRGKRPK